MINPSDYYKYLIDLCKDQSELDNPLFKNIPKIFRTITNLLKSEDLSSEERNQLFVVVGYFFIPDDLYPEETMGVDGLIDDVLLAMFVIENIAAKYGNGFIAMNSPLTEEEIDDILNDHFVQLRIKHFNIYTEVLAYTGLIDDQDASSLG